MAHFIFAGLLVFCLQRAALADAAGAERNENVLFERQISSNGARLVVVRGPDIDPSLFDFWKGSNIDQVGKAYAIRVEVRAPNKPALLVATHLHRENKLTPLLNQEFCVLDALVEPGLIVLATTGGGDISVWRIQVFGAPATCWLRLGAPWDRHAAPSALNHQVSVKLGRAADGHLTMEVVDKRGQPPHEHTLYVQGQETDPQLQRDRQWQEN
jgi:hypothetical protein